MALALAFSAQAPRKNSGQSHSTNHYQNRGGKGGGGSEVMPNPQPAPSPVPGPVTDIEHILNELGHQTQEGLRHAVKTNKTLAEFLSKLSDSEHANTHWDEVKKASMHIDGQENAVNAYVHALEEIAAKSATESQEVNDERLGLVNIAANNRFALNLPDTLKIIEDLSSEEIIATFGMIKDMGGANDDQIQYAVLALLEALYTASINNADRKVFKNLTPLTMQGLRAPLMGTYYTKDNPKKQVAAIKVLTFLLQKKSGYAAEQLLAILEGFGKDRAHNDAAANILWGLSRETSSLDSDVDAALAYAVPTH